MAVWGVFKKLSITALCTEKIDVKSKTEDVKIAPGRCFMPCCVPQKGRTHWYVLRQHATW